MVFSLINEKVVTDLRVVGGSKTEMDKEKDLKERGGDRVRSLSF